MSEPLRFRDGALVGGDWPAFAVIGDPIDHTLSPRLHAAALAARGSTDHYGAIHVPAAELASFLTTAGERGMRGLNVTVPHKRAVLDGCVRRTEEVDAIGAANTLVRRDDAWIAHNTDARGFALALQRAVGRGLSEALREVMVLGAGGAARAVVVALRAMGAGRVRIASRRRDAAAWAEAHGVEWCAFPDAVAPASGLLVNATTLGLRDADPFPMDPTGVPVACRVMDLVYAEAGTRWVRSLQEAGREAEDGRAMLVAQAALASTLWFGSEAPLVPMAEAVGFDW